MTDRASIAGVERAWASPAALRERCPSCGRTQVLAPTWGRAGGERVCFDAQERAEAVLRTLPTDRQRGALDEEPASS